MTVKKLSAVTFDELLDCFLAAFDNYFVKMPTDSCYYKKRWKAAKVDFNYSYQRLAQFDLLTADNEGWKRLFSAIKLVSNAISIINVDEGSKDKIAQIRLVGLENKVNQYELELGLEDVK